VEIQLGVNPEPAMAQAATQPPSTGFTTTALIQPVEVAVL
jgi:hypothetical protein